MVKMEELHQLARESVAEVRNRAMFLKARIYPCGITFEEFKILRELCKKDGFKIEMTLEHGEYDSYQVIDITW